MDPERADREWIGNTRPRVDDRMPLPPRLELVPPPDPAAVDREPKPGTLADSRARLMACQSELKLAQLEARLVLRTEADAAECERRMREEVNAALAELAAEARRR